MRVEVTGADWRRAHEVYRLFKAKPDSEHIASEFALAHLAAVLRSNEIKSVLEFGAGIGTATYLILSSLPEARVDCTERVPLCLDALEANIPSELRRRLTVHSGKEPVSGAFDLVVMDGRTDPSALRLAEGAICFAEGDRTRSRAAIETSVAARGLRSDFTQYQPRRTISLRPTRFGIPIPTLIQKGCWIGNVQASSRDTGV